MSQLYVEASKIVAQVRSHTRGLSSCKYSSAAVYACVIFFLFALFFLIGGRCERQTVL